MTRPATDTPAAQGLSCAAANCGAKIFFVRTTRGKSLPLDLAPRPDGNVWIGDDGFARTLTKHDAPPPDGRPRYVSHFATCAAAARFRKVKPA